MKKIFLIIRRLYKILITGMVLACLAVSMAMADGEKIPLRHPDQGENLRNCMECHDADDPDFPYLRFNHTKQFVDGHGSRAIQSENVCTMCHYQSFCADCHGVGTELKPSVKNHANPMQRMPHRGDYLSRHRIEGRLDPVQCFRCHGSPKTQRSCSSCHG